MTDLKGKNLDDFFRKKLSEADIPFEEANWLRLEKRLKGNKSKKKIAWAVLSGIAAMLLLTLAISEIFLGDSGHAPITANKGKNNQNIAVDSIPQIKENSRAASTLSNNTQETANNFTDLNITTKNQAKKSSGVKPLLSTAQLPIFEPVHPQPVKTDNKDNNEQLNVFNTQSSPDGIPKESTQTPINPPEVLSNLKPDAGTLKKDTVLKADRQPARSQGTFSVAFVAGPDINGVNNLKSNRGGVAVGLLLNYGITNSISISTGVLYAKKLYNSEFEYYKPASNYVFPNTPTAVNADCRVLDIPLNINYTAWAKNKNTLAVSAGISSYLMLNEGYSFTYETPTTRGPKSYYITNRNKHYMGILNFGAAYERKISNEVSIGIQPYMKVPVTGIGYGNVKLISTGVLTSVKLNLSPNKK